MLHSGIDLHERTAVLGVALLGKIDERTMKSVRLGNAYG